MRMITITAALLAGSVSASAEPICDATLVDGARLHLRVLQAPDPNDPIPARAGARVWNAHFAADVELRHDEKQPWLDNDVARHPADRTWVEEVAPPSREPVARRDDLLEWAPWLTEFRFGAMDSCIMSLHVNSPLGPASYRIDVHLTPDATGRLGGVGSCAGVGESDDRSREFHFVCTGNVHAPITRY